MVKTPTFIAYYRVSTKRQGQSGLGLAAQQESVRAYVSAAGGKVSSAFTETESGTRCDRPELAKALRKARATGAVLLIARLCRLARNVHFVSGLLESKVKFVCVDMPEADRTMLQMVSVFAEYESRCVSERTRLALAAAKRRGTLLGMDRPGHTINWRKGMRNGLHLARASAAAARASKREDCYSDLLDDMRAWRAAGASYRAIAERLNAAEHRTTGGAAFQAMTVARLLR